MVELEDVLRVLSQATDADGQVVGITSPVARVITQRFPRISQLEDDDITDNVFCPTGKGGGIDASCSPGKSAHVEVSITTGQHLAEHLAKSFANHSNYGRFSKADMREVSALNPNGLAEGKIKLSWDYGDHLFPAYAKAIKDVLPKGVEIGRAHV